MGAAGFEPEPEGPARFAARAASGRLQILRGRHLLLASARRKMMGAAGFEPAAAWSEAKYSVQTELSALGRI